jgi:LPXTG-motif cell wall-anchored protein
MKKFAAALTAALLALLGFVAFAPSANAYPPPTPPKLYLTLSTNRVVSGHSFNATAKATVSCDTITLRWNGVTASAAGSTVKHRYKAPIVSSDVVITAHATCVYTATSGQSGAAISATTKTLYAEADVTVVPAHGKGGKLPNTGGPSIGWLIGGIAALLAGAGAMFAGRRRDAGVASS